MLIRTRVDDWEIIRMSEQQEPVVAGESERAASAAVRLVLPGLTDQPPVYSNFAQVTMGPHDFVVHFGWYSVPPLTEAPEQPVDVPVRPLVSVTIPLTMVHGLRDALNSTVANWEANFGRSLPTDPTKRSAAGEGASE